CDFLFVTHDVTKPLQDLFVFGIHCDVAEYGEVIASSSAPKMFFQHIDQLCSAIESSSVLLVSEKFHSSGLEEREFGWQRAGRFMFSGEFGGLDFAGFDIRLIEGIDADDRTGNRSCNFPAEKFLADGVRVRHRDANDGMAGLFEGGYSSILRFVRF